MIGGVTHHMLPHLSGVLHFNVNRPLVTTLHQCYMIYFLPNWGTFITEIKTKSKRIKITRLHRLLYKLWEWGKETRKSKASKDQKEPLWIWFYWGEIKWKLKGYRNTRIWLEKKVENDADYELRWQEFEKDIGREFWMFGCRCTFSSPSRRQLTTRSPRKNSSCSIRPSPLR